MNARNPGRRRHALARLSLVLVLATLCAGCGLGPMPGGTSATGASMVRSKLERQPAPAPDSPAVAELVAGHTAYALDLYSVLFDADENLMISPHSLSVALGMTYAGARGETEAQMAEALHFTLPQSDLHPAFNGLDAALATASNDDEVTLRIANAVWGQRGEAYEAPFLDTLAAHYGAGMQTVDFARSEQARGAINDWVNQRTEGRIEELLPPGAITGEVSLVLANAVYLNAAWLHPFPAINTREGAFIPPHGDEIRVPMMTRIAPYGYAQGEGARAVELPYVGEQLSMVILLPDEGRFEAFARDLDPAALNALLNAIEPMQVQLTMPRFAFDAATEMKKPLMTLGMVDPFGRVADFSGMDGTRELYIDQVYHQAAIAVDEGGTEAAAGSAVVMQRKGPAFDVAIMLDRPFLVLVRHVDTGAILFLGHVVNPVE